MAKTGRNDPCPCGSGKKYKKCHGGSITTPSIETALEDMYRELHEIEGHSFRQISERFEELVRDLSSYDRLSSMTAVAALSLLAENRTCIVRLDSLLHFAAIHANGRQQVTVGALDRWLNQFLSHSPLSRREDPAEDIAVGNVMTPSGNRRVFTGDWSNPDYYLQDVLDALHTGPDTLRPLRAECDSVLRISNLLATRKGYPRLTGKPESESSTVWLPASDEEMWFLSRQALIDSNDLAALQIAVDLIRPFSITFDEFCSRASNTTLGGVRRRPFITLADVQIVAQPTAIPMAVISHIFSSVRNLGLLAGLQKSLGRIQGRRTLRQAVDGVPTRDFLTALLPRDGAPPAHYVSQTAFRFDEDKYLHLLFLHDDVYEIESAGVVSQWQPPFRDSFATFIQASAQRLVNEGGCTSGLTLVIMGGVWRGCAIALPRKPIPNCGIQVWSSADADRLMANEHRWKLLLWKLSMQRSALEELGLSFEAHSDANLYSMWTHHDYQLVPRDAGPDSPNYVALGPEFIFDMRLDHRSGMDDHCVYRPDRVSWERVRKLNSKSHFKEDSARKRYGALLTVARGVLEGVVETSSRAWWVDCSTSPSNPIRRHLIYNVWETAVNWIDKIAPVLDVLIPELGTDNVIFRLDLSEIANHEDWTAEGVMSIQAATFIPNEVLDRVVSLRLPIAFVTMGYSPKNDAERLLVKGFVHGALAVAGLADNEDRAAQIDRSLALSDDDRFMHLSLTRDVRHYLQEFDYQAAELLHDDDLAFGAIQIAQEAGLQAPSKIDSVESSNSALNQLVDSFWKRIEERLRQIDRASLITACITNHERMLFDLDRWQLTSRAVLSLHNDRSDVLKATQALKAKRDRTQITHRIMIEMAVCTCPLKDGRSVTQSDIDYLGTQVLLLIRTAAQSDAVRACCADPSIQISALGDFTFGDNFMDVMLPYVTSHFEKNHLAEVERYGDLFVPPPMASKTQEEVFGRDFVESFQGEFGITPGRLAELGMVLLEDAIKQSAIVLVRESASLQQTLSAAGFSQSEVEGVWRSFVLGPRDRWDAVQKPFRDKDWFPWRYRRRLSLMARPFVDLGDGRVAYAPGFCEDSFRHIVMECFHGAFETGYFDTKRMKEFVGAINARRGLDFNKSVGALFSANGWNVRMEVEISALGAPPNEASGDVDVLAWKGNVVCVCECKELLFARNISEVADQLVRFRGLAGDDLDKHLRRVGFIRSHNNNILRLTNLTNPRVVALLITSKIVPMQFMETVGTEVVSADQVTPAFLDLLQ
jgi:hypothetical protein